MSGSEGRAKPVRPGITPLFASGCLFWATCAGAYSFARQWEASLCFHGALAAFVACLAVAGAFFLVGKRGVALLAAAAFVGGILVRKKTGMLKQDTEQFEGR